MLRSRRINVAQALVDVGSAALAGIAGLVALLDIGVKAQVLWPAAVLIIVVATAVGALRYWPMFVAVDAEADTVEFRNAWRNGSFRWSDVAHFEPKEILLGMPVVTMVLLDGRRITLRGAPFEPFVKELRRVAPEDDSPFALPGDLPVGWMGRARGGEFIGMFVTVEEDPAGEGWRIWVTDQPPGQGRPSDEWELWGNTPGEVLRWLEELDVEWLEDAVPPFEGRKRRPRVRAVWRRERPSDSC